MRDVSREKERERDNSDSRQGSIMGDPTVNFLLLISFFFFLFFFLFV